MSRIAQASRSTSSRHTIGLGQIILALYIVVVLVLTLVSDTQGPSFVAQLASTPAGLLHGSWWQLITSGLVIDGPLVPQVIALAVLGALSIYFRGSWLFWLTALLSHIAGTLVTYLGVGLIWLASPTSVTSILNQPDYGISLIWSAALGMVAAAAWLGPDSSRTPIYRPLVLWGTVVVMVFVTIYSTGLARYEHLAAFSIAFLVVALSPQHRHISRHLARAQR